MKKVALLVCLLLPVLSAGARTSSPRLLNSTMLQSALPPDPPIIRRLRPETTAAKDSGEITSRSQAIAQSALSLPGDPPIIVRFGAAVDADATHKPPFHGTRRPPVRRPGGTPIIRDYRLEPQGEGALMAWSPIKTKPPVPKQNKPPVIRD